MKGIDDDMEEILEESLQDVLLDLQDSSKNLELKTHILKPKDLASLKILSKYLKSLGLFGSSELIKKFIKIYFEYMVSFNRESRKEIIKAITGMLEREQTKVTIADRLTTNLK